MNNKSGASKYISAKEVAETFGVSEDLVRGLVKELKYGRNYIDCRAKESGRALYRFNKEEMENYFKVPPERR